MDGMNERREEKERHIWKEDGRGNVGRTGILREGETKRYEKTRKKG